MTRSHGGKAVTHHNTIGQRPIDVMNCNAMRPAHHVCIRAAEYTPDHTPKRDSWQGSDVLGFLCAFEGRATDDMTGAHS
jgi:hypothetical protein